MTASTNEILGGSYDLTYRPEIGSDSYYRRRTVYRHLDSRGVIQQRQAIQGDFRRLAQSAEPSGRVQEKITWRNVGWMVAKGTQPFGPPEPMPFAEEFTYQLAVEDEYRDFDNSIFDGLPRELLSWFFVLLVRDTQAPLDNLRSKRLDVHKLRRVGDIVERRPSPEEVEVPPNLKFPGFIDVPRFDVAVIRTQFASLTVRNSEPCAHLRFEVEPCTFEMIFMENRMRGGSSFQGTITIRLSDGTHEEADCLEYVMFDDGRVISPYYKLDRITEAEYEAGLGT